MPDERQVEVAGKFAELQEAIQKAIESEDESKFSLRTVHQINSLCQVYVNVFNTLYGSKPEAFDINRPVPDDSIYSRADILLDEVIKRLTGIVKETKNWEL